jgi:polysaccharide biosynthesis/export protein
MRSLFISALCMSATLAIVRPLSAGAVKEDLRLAEHAASGAITVSRGYRIGAGDVLQVIVWKEPDASAASIQVRSDGVITLPFVRELQVDHLTISEAEALITQKLSNYVRDPDVTVLVKEVNSEKIYILGAVKREGAFAMKSSMTILQALAEAGGLTDYAKRKKIYVLRFEARKEVRLPFNYDAVISGRATGENAVLRPGDTIVVPQ